MTSRWPLTLDRSTSVPLAEQIRTGIVTAIATGVLTPGARLPSWRDLAAQLGVARGTVRVAYERLLDAQLIVSSRTHGTRVAAHAPNVAPRPETADRTSALPEVYRDYSSPPGVFRMGVPTLESFPVKLFARMRARAVRIESTARVGYPDPRGEPELRREIAGHLAISRAFQCLPSQIVITAGFTGALGLTLRVLGLEGRTAWMENPGFPLTRRGLEIARLQTVSVPVTDEGLDVAAAVSLAPDAAVAVVTPGQQAPLGGTLSLARRLALLDWAAATGAWVVEDDYLGELQLQGRAAPALAALDKAGRVIHIGSFSKTISPTLRLGFIVAPPELAPLFVEAATCLAPAPGPAVQLATADFMREGHYLRHLRRLKRAYSTRRDALSICLADHGLQACPAGLAMMLQLPDGFADTLMAKEARKHGLAPAPLSPWYSGSDAARSGLLLGVATAPTERIDAACHVLSDIVLAAAAWPTL